MDRLPLTPRLREVLGLLAEGHTQAEVAEQLCLAPSSVKTYVHRILVEMNARNPTQAVAIAIRDHWLSENVTLR